MNIDRKNTLKRIKKENMFYALDIFDLRHIIIKMWEYLMPIWNEIGYNGITILWTGHKDLMSHSYTYGVASIFVLFHYVSAGTLRFFRGIFIMYENLWVHTDGNDSSQIVISLVTQVAVLAAPISQASNRAFMFLERLHLCSVFNVYCKNASLAVPYEQLSLPRIQDHTCKFICRVGKASINTWEPSRLRVPDLQTVWMHCYEAH